MGDQSPKLQPTALQLPTPYDRRQRHKMALALVLVLIAIGVFVTRDWHNLFGSGDTSTTDWDSGDGDRTSGPAAHVRKAPIPVAPAKSKAPVAASNHAVEATAPPPPAVVNRTTLPPLEVEVVAGNGRHTVRTGNNAIRVELPNSISSSASDLTQPQVSATVQPAANAGERVKMSADTSHVLERPVQPSYPMLARQMKLQGAVVLQALIGVDGAIQDLKVLSGPAILASAAQEAVRQWRFKPYLQNGVPVETEAKITVNFTISTL
jgi:periplasmic protein TonB